MAETNEFYIKIGADVNEATTKLNQLSQQLSQFGSNAQTTSNKISGSMSGASSSIVKAFSAIGVSLSIASIIGIGKSALQTAADLEQTAVAFKVFTGSAQAANIMLSQLKAQALNSPMQFQDIVKGAQTLLQYGLTAKQTTEITRMLGDISGGNADKFQRLSLAFGQVTASGRLMGQEARQMINAGFNPLQAISDKTGQSMAVLTKRMHDGQISVKEVADAFIYATSEGGRFFGMADEQSKTLAGAYNKMSESITFTLADMGQNLNKSLDLSGAATHISNLVAKLGENFVSTGEKSTFWANALKNLLSDLALIIDLIIKGVQSLGNLFEELSSNSGLDSFSKWLDDSTIKLAGLFGEESQKNVRDFLGYLNSFDSAIVGVSKALPSGLEDAIPVMEKQAEELSKKMKWQISIDTEGYNKSLAELNKIKGDILVLKKGSGRSSSFDLGFSNKPSKASDDDQTKAEKNKIERLKKLNEEAALRINEIWATGTDKKLITLENNYKLEIRDFEKHGVKYNNITKKYEEERTKIIDDAAKNRAVSESNYFNDVLQGLTATYERIEKAEISRVKNLFSELQSEVSGIEIAYPKSFDDFVDDFVKKDNEKKLETYTNSLTSALQDFGVNIYSGFANIAGSALAGITTFGDAIAQVGSMFLNLIGDLLIQMGTSAIKLGLSAEAIEKVLAAIGVPGGGLAAVGVGMLAVAAGSLLKGMGSKTNSAISSKSSGAQVSSTSGSSSGMKSGSTYSYGGASYSTQSIRLAIDLTGAITSTQTGYQINKSLETTLRVTGRQ